MYRRALSDAKSLECFQHQILTKRNHSATRYEHQIMSFCQYPRTGNRFSIHVSQSIGVVVIHPSTCLVIVVMETTCDGLTLPE